MSIKSLFTNNKSNQIQKTQTIESASAEVEGVNLVKAKTHQKNEFIPPIDFSTASNFAKFGSAELYYEYSFERIYNEYPYDGTLAEKIQFENSSSYLDKYIFENLYPRTNGFVNFGTRGMNGSKASGYLNTTSPLEYISIAGGPHTASGGMSGSPLAKTFDNSTLYDVNNRRVSNLEFNPVSGSTIEFWLKKDAFTSIILQRGNF